ncbi:sodium-dependent proline transporter-like [Amphibalanus amphitrite]|uniref:sodium-dependent proline transporter-like n=1 Tax=Amphibalanus amphitrite TaxID=1232801 RepID=UPI001C905172|nr:sodium-dependent proline transporter-like [Amphibalanus amphitrite]
MCVKLAVYIGTTEYILGPRLAWHYGGFIFYFVVMCLVLISSYPANFLESLAGQYSAKSVVVLLTQLGPLFRGLGYAMLIITGLIMVYYSAHVAKVFMYAYHAPQVSLPWHDCSADYNSKHCFLEELEEHCNKGYNHSVYYDFKCIPASTYCVQNGYHEYNGSHCLRDAHTNITLRWMVDHTERRLRNVTAANASEVGSVGERFISSRDFHYHYISGRYECQKNVSLPVCENNVRAFLVAYCAVWILALLPCFNLWVASTFAMVVIVASPLVTLLVMTRVVLFPGAWAGVSNFFFGRANLAQLLTKNFWMDACGMTLWSLSFGTGVIPTLSSRDRLRHNALRSCTILVTADVVFGLLNSILLFSVRGHLERHVGISKDQLQQLDHDSEALVFVAFTTITDGMPRPRFWGSIYFGTMAAQALATLAMIMVSLALNLVDAVPSFRGRPFWLAVLVAVAPFILCATVLAVSVFHDVRLPLYPLVRLQLSFVALLFIVVVGFKLSRPEFRDQVQVQLGIDARGVWRQMLASWLVVCPFIVLIEILGQLMVYRFPPVPPGGLPTAVFAYTAALCPLLALVVGAVYSARTTPFWELCNTSKQFGHRERRARRRTLTPAVSARSRRSSMRRGTIGVVRSLTAEDATSRRSATSEISDEMKTVLGVR